MQSKKLNTGTLPQGSTIVDALQHLPVPEEDLFLLTLNGRNDMRGLALRSGIETGRELREGDVLSVSRLVPPTRPLRS